MSDLSVPYNDTDTCFEDVKINPIRISSMGGYLYSKNYDNNYTNLPCNRTMFYKKYLDDLNKNYTIPKKCLGCNNIIMTSPNFNIEKGVMDNSPKRNCEKSFNEWKVWCSTKCRDNSKIVNKEIVY